MGRMQGVVAAGHPATAQAGAAVLRAGGNAVDAAVAASLTSWACEPLLNGPGAGGYLLVAGAGVEPAVLDFFVSAPSPGERAPLHTVRVDFGDAEQLFHVGGASCGVPGTPAGLEHAVRRWGTLPLAELAAPAATLAREGVVVNAMQGYVSEILEAILLSTPAVAERLAPGGRALREGDVFRDAELAATSGTITAEDLAGYRAVERRPAEVAFRGKRFLTNPPPSAGGVLLALAVSRLERSPAPAGPPAVVAAMADAQAARTPAFDAGLAEPGFLDRFLAAQLGSTTHVSVVDRDGLACGVTCTNGEGSGVVVPGTGIHVNNVMGEEDLSPQGFFAAPAGRRMPSMMAPTAVLEGDEVQLVLGSAGSNRIRSAILQTVVGVVDRDEDPATAVEAPRLHFEAGTVFHEPGVDVAGLQDVELVAFRERNLFFGGVQAVARDPRTGRLTAGADPRRGGAVAWA
jgi:gamma-glutamyltranspeptidase / glutathione hydrolase